MIYLAAKAPGEAMDYNLDMTCFVPTGFSIDSAVVTVTDAGNTESPIELEAFDVSTQPLMEGDTVNLAILFWLRGGTVNTRYRGTIAMSDNQSSNPDRTYNRRFEIEIQDL
jgi:hypothetical protein